MNHTQFSQEDFAQIEKKGHKFELIRQQLAMFEKGVPFLQLNRACTVGDGIVQVPPSQHETLCALADEAQSAGRATKFVPASGAASRMFKALHAAKETLEAGKPVEDGAFRTFIDNLHRFAFYPELSERLAELGVTLSQPVEAAHHLPVLQALLDDDAMNYGNLPKGLLQFHKEGDRVRTSVEEHFVEASAYGVDAEGTARLHFTVSPEHFEAFQDLVDEKRDDYERDGLKLEIGYSFQKPATDTIAVDMENLPFREESGQLLFRPGGHGALIENLNDLDGDILFIKNIDNVVPDRLKDTTILYKKILAGHLMRVQRALFAHLNWLDENELNPQKRDELFDFAAVELGFIAPEAARGLDDKEAHDYLHRLLNRPLRVCGMVKNEGEPGGGPFWVTGKDGAQSVQIVESSQIDHHDAEQAGILSSSTHFNPVDLVCAVRDYRDNRFNLPDYVDDDACFISEKSKSGKSLKALELPGLWNGAMASWNTVFVEVPLITFNPVKTVNDLLRDAHQPGN